MEGEELRQGKDRVQVHLLDRLDAIGMQRGKGMTVAKAEAMFERLQCFLAYMPSDVLDALAEVVERNAAGILRNTWPAEVTVTNWARNLMPAPPSESRLVRSYVQSVGEGALAEGHLTELYLYLKKFGRPPNDDGWRLIRERARDNAGRAARAKELGGEFELNWLAGYNRNAARVLELLHTREPKVMAE